jgi:hypothetical protein
MASFPSADEMAELQKLSNQYEPDLQVRRVFESI